jgi:hypothetical protein
MFKPSMKMQHQLQRSFIALMCVLGGAAEQGTQ